MVVVVFVVVVGLGVIVVGFGEVEGGVVVND